MVVVVCIDVGGNFGEIVFGGCLFGYCIDCIVSCVVIGKIGVWFF